MIEILGWVGGGIVLLSLMQRSHARLHALNIIACLLFVVYDVLMNLPSMLAMNLALLTVSTRQLRRLRASKSPRPRSELVVPARVNPEQNEPIGTGCIA